MPSKAKYLRKARRQNGGPISDRQNAMRHRPLAGGDHRFH
jgi:hypothetical protein